MNTKKIIKKIIIIFVYCVVLGELLLWFTIGLTVPAVPDDRLENAISFMQESDYIGLTVDECEELLGEEGKKWTDHVSFYAGVYRYQRDGEFMLSLYYNDEEKVIYAELEETWY